MKTVLPPLIAVESRYGLDLFAFAASLFFHIQIIARPIHFPKSASKEVRS
jgi:hypothetical protein